MSKGARFRSIRRMIRLDKENEELVKIPAMVKSRKFKLIRNKETDKLEKKFPLVKHSFKKQIINKNKVGYRKIKKQFFNPIAFNKAFGETAKQTEKKYYETLNYKEDFKKEKNR